MLSLQYVEYMMFFSSWLLWLLNLILIDNTTTTTSDAWVSLKPNTLTIQIYYTTNSQSHLQLKLLLLRPLLLFPKRENMPSLHEPNEPVVDHFSHEN
jgi:hypothetical protein